MGAHCTVLVVEMSELSKPEEDLQDPGKAQGPVEVPLLAEVGVAASHLASDVLASSSNNVEALPQEILDGMMGNLLKFLLFNEVSECLRLVFGVEIKEVDRKEHIYTLVPTLGLTCDEILRDREGLPKAGFLALVLSVIMLCGEPAPEEAVWGALSRMGVYVGREHCVFAEPRELLTRVWVQEGYLEYQQMPDSHPAHYVFLWGPRAYVETSKWQVMAFMLRVNERDLRAFPFLSAEDAREEE
ncbi:melanoma-associated antigen 10-like [Dama dama]|uniref:melanoma-associated antigen 10-like n=1 Tax=Dama dama TaxID=30532 RepID=UPI002A36BF8A|nr:melanoma-associated antigen 10-like [Dama dama]